MTPLCENRTSKQRRYMTRRDFWCNAGMGIGGLALATVSTLLLLPMLVAVVQSGASRRSPSLDPEDPESVHFEQLGPESGATA